MSHKGCKHLDYDGNYIDCKIVDLGDMGKYWERQNPPYPEAATKVQFCKLRGRINGVFQCINEGEMSCFEEKSQ